MAVNGGAGNAISFSEIQAFYGGSNPISISEYNRGGSLVPASFSGSSTATTGTSSQTVDDFAVTVTEVDGALQTSSQPIAANSLTGSFTVQNTTSFVNSTTAFVNGTSVWYKNGTSIEVQNGVGGSFTIAGPQYNSGDRTLSVSSITNGTVTFSAGDVFSVATSGPTTNASTHGFRAIEYDITFQNNNSTGDTYNLTSNSTGGSSKTAYAAGDSFLAQDNGSSNQFILAYDNVTGSGPGTAGDIGVTETSAFTGTLESNTTVRASNSATTGSTVSASYTVLASDAVLILSGGGLNNQSGDDPPEPAGSWSTSGVINISPVAAGQQKFYRGPAYQSGDYSNLTFSGNISAGTFTITGTVGTNSGSVSVATARRAAQYTTIFTNNSGSKSYTLGSSSTGGAATLAAGATRNAQTTNSSNSNWAVYFDTSSGNCNTNIPTTIGSGNSVNLDLFNAPGTPVG